MSGIQTDPSDQKKKNQPGELDLVGQNHPSQAIRAKFIHSDDELLDANSAALFLGLSTRTLERWRCERTGPSFLRLSVRAVRYRLSDLRTWRDSRAVVCE